MKNLLKSLQPASEIQNSVWTVINKFHRLPQGDRLASEYAVDFRHLASYTPWDDQALMERFHFHLRNDVIIELGLIFVWNVCEKINLLGETTLYFGWFSTEVEEH